MKELREVERSVSMSRHKSGRKKFMVDAVLNGHQLKLFENRRDVTSFVTFHDACSCCILCCLLSLCLRQASKKTITIVQL